MTKPRWRLRSWESRPATKPNAGDAKQFADVRQDAARRKTALVVDVAVALEERDAAVVRLEMTAGRGLVTLALDQGAAIGDLNRWIPSLAEPEARRLRRLAEEASATHMSQT